ncbi:MAG: site-specific DNA-methyltransferase [Clostridia bacterium]|nr:site-specific DNA-methyltransferase [Clostridia bacterium]
MTTDVIYLGDCISGMAKQVEDASVDLVIADPPHYRAGKQGEARFPSEEAYFAFSEGWLRETSRVLRGGGSLYLFTSLETFCKLFPILTENGLELRQQILVAGEKKNASVGSKKARAFPSATESIFLLTKDPRPFISAFLREKQAAKGYSAKEMNELLGVHTGGGGMWSHYTGNLLQGQVPTEKVWKKLQELLEFDLPYTRISQTFHPCEGLSSLWNDVAIREEKDRLHPAQKTQKLLTRLLCISSEEGDVVLDPFMGSGSTAEACTYQNRRYLGFEQNEKYYNMAIERVANRQLTLF